MLEILCFIVVKYFMLVSVNGWYLDYFNKVFIKIFLLGYVYICVFYFIWLLFLIVLIGISVSDLN